MYSDLKTNQDSSGTYNSEDMYSMIKTKNKNSKPLISYTKTQSRGIKKTNKKKADSKNTSATQKKKSVKKSANKNKHKTSAKKSSVLPASEIKSSNKNESSKTYPDLVVHVIHKSLLEEISSLTSRPNVVLSMMEGIKYVDAIHDYERLIYCSKVHPNEEVKNQLSKLMFPLFIFLYMHLLLNEGSLRARYFLRRYRFMFLYEEEKNKSLDALHSCENIHEALKYPYFEKIWSYNYCIKLPSHIFAEMISMFQHTQSKIFLPRFHILFMSDDKLSYSNHHGDEKVPRF